MTKWTTLVERHVDWIVFGKKGILKDSIVRQTVFVEPSRKSKVDSTVQSCCDTEQGHATGSSAMFLRGRKVECRAARHQLPE